MTITFRFVADFGSIQWYLFGFLVLVVLISLLLARRVVCALEKWVEYYGQRREAPTVWSPSPSQGTSSQVGQVTQEVRRPTELVVPQISPEAILKRAPKPAGFGGTGDGNKQPEQPDPEDCDKPPGEAPSYQKRKV